MGQADPKLSRIYSMRHGVEFAGQCSVEIRALFHAFAAGLNFSSQFTADPGPIRRNAVSSRGGDELRRQAFNRRIVGVDAAEISQYLQPC